MPRGGNKFELLKEQKGVQGKVEPGGVGGPGVPGRRRWPERLAGPGIEGLLGLR